MTTGDRYVLLGVARPRSTWFRDVARWATSAALPAEFLKCVSVEELRAQLASGRVLSAVLLDGSLPAVDRDLLDAVREAGGVALVIDGDGRRDWVDLGAAAVLVPDLELAVLLDVLASRAPMVGGPGSAVLDEDAGDDVVPVTGMVAAVCGAGGTGTSTVAAALAQGLAVQGGRHVVLADLALHAEQAMLHDVRDVVPGVQELVEAHRSHRPGELELRSFLFEITERRYHLLLGLRRARFWPTLRPRAFEAAFESLRRTFDVTVCDLTADFEDEDGGSVDVAERTLPARTAVRAADVVFVVARPGAKGLHALVRVLGDLAGIGAPPDRLVPVFNLAPRHPGARAELAAALSELAPADVGGPSIAPVFLPVRRVEQATLDVTSLPAPLSGLLAGAFDAVAARAGSVEPVCSPEPVAVAPGSLGHWSEDDRG